MYFATPPVMEYSNTISSILALGLNYFGIQYVAIFSDRFIAKTYRYASAFLSQGQPNLVIFT